MSKSYSLKNGVLTIQKGIPYIKDEAFPDATAIIRR